MNENNFTIKWFYIKKKKLMLAQLEFHTIVWSLPKVGLKHLKSKEAEAAKYWQAIGNNPIYWQQSTGHGVRPGMFGSHVSRTWANVNVGTRPEAVIVGPLQRLTHEPDGAVCAGEVGRQLHLVRLGTTQNIGAWLVKKT